MEPTLKAIQDPYPLLSVDSAYRTSGWVVLSAENVLTASGVIKIPKKKAEDPRPVLSVAASEIVCTYQPRVILVEEPYLQRNVATLKKLIKAQQVWFHVAQAFGLGYYEIPPNEWQGAFLSGAGKKRGWLKSMSVTMVEALFGKKLREDEADAACMGVYWAKENRLLTLKSCA